MSRPTRLLCRQQEARQPRRARWRMGARRRGRRKWNRGRNLDKEFHGTMDMVHLDKKPRTWSPTRSNLSIWPGWVLVIESWLRTWSGVDSFMYLLYSARGIVSWLIPRGRTKQGRHASIHVQAEMACFLLLPLSSSPEKGRMVPRDKMLSRVSSPGKSPTHRRRGSLAPRGRTLDSRLA